MDKSIKFLGGKITLRSAAVDKIMPSGAKQSWSQAITIEVGKSKIALQKDFLKKLNELVSDPENRDFFDTLPES